MSLIFISCLTVEFGLSEKPTFVIGQVKLDCLDLTLPIKPQIKAVKGRLLIYMSEGECAPDYLRY